MLFLVAWFVTFEVTIICQFLVFVEVRKSACRRVVYILKIKDEIVA